MYDVFDRHIRTHCGPDNVERLTYGQCMDMGSQIRIDRTNGGLINSFQGLRYCKTLYKSRVFFQNKKGLVDFYESNRFLQVKGNFVSLLC